MDLGGLIFIFPYFLLPYLYLIGKSALKKENFIT